MRFVGEAKVFVQLMADVERLWLTDACVVLKIELASMVTMQNVLVLLHLEILSSIGIRTFTQLLFIFETHHDLVRAENAFVEHREILSVDRVLLVCADFPKVSLDADFFSKLRLCMVRRRFARAFLRVLGMFLVFIFGVATCPLPSFTVHSQGLVILHDRTVLDGSAARVSAAWREFRFDVKLLLVNFLCHLARLNHSLVVLEQSSPLVERI